MNLEVYLVLFSLLISVVAFGYFTLVGILKFPNNQVVHQVFFSAVLFSLLISLFIRGINLGRFPCSNLYESLLIVALGIAGVTIFFAWKHKITFLGWPSSVLITAVLAYALSLPESQREAIPLIPALNSYWRAIHVPALLISYGFLTIAGIIAGFYLFEETNSKEQSDKIQKLDFYQELIYKCVTFGFPLLTFGIVTGALWANHTWGNLWQWDPKENLALVTWFIYLAYLHLKLSGKASAKTLALINLFGIIAIYITYIGINQFDLGGLHTYGKV